jgi:hypothetical protein
VTLFYFTDGTDFRLTAVAGSSSEGINPPRINRRGCGMVAFSLMTFLRNGDKIEKKSLFLHRQNKKPSGIVET